ncbi:MAG: translation initiation factor IF-2 N-terminal domain-containing protein, partial [Candidatus Cloacimonas sp.]|nr:translation initiation factor IF-2 N-terminal domain-containing protein [Candidatus Cloacimonas sp.]
MQIRVHELAKELKISTMALKKHLTDLGVNIKSHMSFIEGEVADKIRMKYNEQIDAEKRAERDRKRLIELRQAAKAKPETPAPKAEPLSEPTPPIPEEVEPSLSEEIPVSEEIKPETIVVVPQPGTDKTSEPLKPMEPHKHAAEAPKSYFESKPETRTAEAPVRRPPYPSATPRAGQRPDSRPDTRPDTRRPTQDYRKRPDGTPPPKPVAPAGTEIKKPLEQKQFGKVKVNHEELGDKSKHKKAIITSTKKVKTKVAEPVEVDEAAISRN